MKISKRTSKLDTVFQSQLRSYDTRFTILPNQKNVEGFCWIYLELTVIYRMSMDFKKVSTKRVRKRFNTSIPIEPTDWSFKKRQSKRDVEINKKLNRYYNDFISHINNIQEGKEITTEDKDLLVLQELFVSDKAKQKIRERSIIDYIDEYIEYRKNSGTPQGTLKEFISLKNRLAKFPETITFENINLTLSDKLINHFSNQKIDGTEKKYHPNTISKTFKIFKTVLSYYYERREELNLTMTDKFKSKQFGQVKEYKTDPIALSDTEIEVLESFNFNTPLKKALADFEKEFKKGKIEAHQKNFYISNIKNKYSNLDRTRQRVLLQLSTGLRVSDLFKIKPANVKKDIIVMRPTKTINTKEDNTIYIPLNRISRKILKEYNYDSSKLKAAAQFYNRSIKEMFEVIGIDDDVEVMEFEGTKIKTSTTRKKFEVLTSHNLRDTFISKAIRENIPIPLILKATGQSSYAVMKRYIKLEDRDLVQYLGALW